MPTYEYNCESCLTEYEERRTYAQADEPSHCPTCGSPRVRRLLSTINVLRGGGDGASLSLGGGGCACSTGGSCACQSG